MLGVALLLLLAATLLVSVMPTAAVGDFSLRVLDSLRGLRNICELLMREPGRATNQGVVIR